MCASGGGGGWLIKFVHQKGIRYVARGILWVQEDLINLVCASEVHDMFEHEGMVCPKQGGGGG